MAKIKKIVTTPNAGKNAEKLAHSQSRGEEASLENSLAVS